MVAAILITQFTQVLGTQFGCFFNPEKWTFRCDVFYGGQVDWDWAVELSIFKIIACFVVIYVLTRLFKGWILALVLSVLLVASTSPVISGRQ